MTQRQGPDRGLILIVDDLRPERLVVAHHVKSLGYRSISVDTGQEALDVLRKQPIDLVLLDILMPDMDGFAVLQEMRADPELAEIPVVVISGSDLANAARSLEAGAEDFITKPFDPRLLHARIRNCLEHRRLDEVRRAQQEQVHRLQEQLEHTNLELKEAQLSMELLAFTDTLTGLPNRRAGQLMLEQQWGVARRFGRSLGCLMIDLDHFDALNDQCGWEGGDAVLRQLSERLRNLKEDGDLLYRAAGDRFAVVCPERGASDCFELARRLHHAIVSESVSHRGRSIPVRASIGVAWLEARGEATLETLLRGADAALNLAKAEGRNQIHAPGLVARSAPRASKIEDPDRVAATNEAAEVTRENPESLRVIAREAALQLSAPIGVVTMLQADRQLLVANHGLPDSLDQLASTPLDYSVCPRIVTTGAPLLIDNAPTDPLWKDHPAVRDGALTAYIGVPLAQADGHILGSLCVVDNEPRSWNDADRKTLEDLAERTMLDVQRRRAEARALRAQVQVQEEFAAAQEERPMNLLASASHELRTPLNGISGMCELLSATSLNEQQREYVSLLALSTTSLLETVNDVLELAKVQSGSFSVTPAAVDLREVVTAALKPLTLRILQDKLDFTLLVDPAVPYRVSLDATRLRQILVNLVGNSTKFTVRGGIRVEVSLLEGRLLFQVQDTGIGVPASRLDDIFEPFQQINGPLQERYRGTGLGLPITRQLTRAMGGTIRCESREGEGTTFFVDLPCEVVEQQPARLQARVELLVDDPALRQALADLLAPWQVELVHGVPSAPAILWVGPGHDTLERTRCRTGAILLLCRPGWQPVHPELAPLARCSWPAMPSELLTWLSPARPSQGAANTPPDAASAARRILVLDDNPTNRRVACGLLKRLGHQTSEASLPSQALQMLADPHYDLVLVDLEMPEMDGFEFARQASALLDGRERKPELVACSAHTDEDIRQRCRDAGMARYMAKPIDTAGLRELLSSLP